MSSVAIEEGGAYQSLQMVLQDAYGIVIGEERKNQITAKLKSVMSQFSLDSLEDLAENLKPSDSTDLRNAVLQAITAHEDAWFAPAELFNLLEAYLLPDMLDTDRSQYRIWVVGSGAGQLPYSLAMKIHEAIESRGSDTRVSIDATDISDTVVKNADEGAFEAVSMKGMSDTYEQKYLDGTSGQWVVSDEIRDMVRFSTCNLLDDFDDRGYYDLVICLDTLVYFSLSMKKQLLEAFARLLDPSGILVAGASEPIAPLNSNFEMVQHEAGTFYRQQG